MPATRTRFRISLLHRDGAGTAASTSGGRSLASRRRLRVAAAAAVLLVILVLWLRPTPLVVETRDVVRAPLEVLVRADGVTRVRDRYDVTAPVTGRIERSAIREGDVVAAGAVIARIAPVPLDPQATAIAQARLSSATAAAAEIEARLAQVDVELAQAERSTGRLRAVAAGEPASISVDALERAEAQLVAVRRERDAAAARLRVATAEVAAARAALQGAPAAGGTPASVRAPAGGTVLRLLQASEAVVPAGAPILQLGDPASLEVVVDVLSTDAVRVATGAPVRLEGWGGAATLEGRVRLVEPAGFTKLSALGVEEQRVNVIVDLLQAPPSLGDGFRVEAAVIVWQAGDVLQVPNGALFRDAGEWSVFIVEDGRARLRRFQAGHRGAGETEVVSGLQPGEVVIVYPSDQVRDGVRVRSR